MEAKDIYSIGYGKGALAYMSFRTAERCCMFFRQHVQVQSRILDCGCGPGTITRGLAQWAHSGQTVGIDIWQEQFVGARAKADELGINNVIFLQGDILDLPFEDNSFDIVFCQAVLYHIHKPGKALAEIKRVLRPGGLAALRDVISSSAVLWPEEPLLREMQRVSRLASLRSGGNPDIGRELGELLYSTGFDNVSCIMNFEQPERLEERSEFFSLVAALREGNLATIATQEGWSTAERLARGVIRLRELGDDPGAVWAVPFGQAIGWKPC